MTIKQILKPNWKAVVILITLLLVLAYLPDYFEFLRTGTTSPSGGIVDFPIWSSISNWIAALIFWYFVACLIVWIYDKVKKKK